MAKRDIKTVKLQLSVDEVTDKVLAQLVQRVGFMGKSKAEVSSWIIRQWIAANHNDFARIEENLAKLGVTRERGGHDDNG